MKIKNWIFLFLVIFYSCDGALHIKIITVENNSFSDLFLQDTLTDGTPVPDVDIELNLANRDKDFNGIIYNLKTDSLGILSDRLPVPPLKKKPVFEGYICWSKEGYKSDTLFFNHSSVDKRVAVINMERLEIWND